jgi:hypothetical protein
MVVEDDTPRRGVDAASAQLSNWRSPSAYVGAPQGIVRKIKMLRAALVGDFVAAGYSTTEASNLIDQNLISEVHLAKTRKKGLAISSDAERLLGLTSRDEVVPPAPAGWQSAHKIAENSGLPYKMVLQQLRRRQLQLIQDAKSTGISTSAARQQVGRQSIALRNLAQGQFKTLIASPEIVRSLTFANAPDCSTKVESGSAYRRAELTQRLHTRLASLISEVMILERCSEAQAIELIEANLTETRKRLSLDPATGCSGP